MDSIQIIFFFFELFVFLFSVVIHEVSHGFVAERLGDPTARLQGRLTLNPLRHIDPVGSVILPLLMAIPMLYGGSPIIFGWAKPVPYNPMYLKNPKSGAGQIALAGPASNLVIALVFAILLRTMPGWPLMPNPLLPVLFSMVAYINILLAIFNLLPIPPLDGSKILFSILPETESTYRLRNTLEQYGFFIILILLLTGGFRIIQPLIGFIYALFVGQPF